MRTVEDVKIALKQYTDELELERKSKSPHFVVVGGNMCITKKGGSTQYILGKGDPIPMIRPTADKNCEKFQGKCMDGMKLEIIQYEKWLSDSIEDCKSLIQCMENGQKPVKVQETTTPQKTSGMTKEIRVVCSECPLGINTCMACRFCEGINLNVLPWTVNCSFNK